MIDKMKKFFSDLWAKVKADVTNAIAVACSFFGGIMAHIDDIANSLDPNFGQTLSTALGDVKWAGRWMLTIGLATMLAKFKALIQSPPKG